MSVHLHTSHVGHIQACTRITGVLYWWPKKVSCLLEERQTLQSKCTHDSDGQAISGFWPNDPVSQNAEGITSNHLYDRLMAVLILRITHTHTYTLTHLCLLIGEGFVICEDIRNWRNSIACWLRMFAHTRSSLKHRLKLDLSRIQSHILNDSLQSADACHS